MKPKSQQEIAKAYWNVQVPRGKSLAILQMEDRLRAIEEEHKYELERIKNMPAHLLDYEIRNGL